MRTFEVTYSVPGACDCCGAALPVAPGAASPGTYRVELPEGTTPTEIRISEALVITIGGGKLEVRLRQARGSHKQWELKKLYNTSAFGHHKVRTEYPEDAPQAGAQASPPAESGAQASPPAESGAQASPPAPFYWSVFNFNLPEFKPTFATWWAELQFFETPYPAHSNSMHAADAHNSAKVSVRLSKLE